MKKMVSAFANAVDYRTYRLRVCNNTMTVDESTGIYHVNQQVDGQQPTLEEFDGRSGKRAIGLLSWLTTLRDTFDMMGTSEASAVRIIAYFLGVEAKDVHEKQFGMVEFDFS